MNPLGKFFEKENAVNTLVTVRNPAPRKKIIKTQAKVRNFLMIA